MRLFSTKILDYAKKYKAIQILGGECQKCGENRFFRLSFHHISNDKESKIQELKGYRWEIIEKEIKKCILLCHNCHNEEHTSKNFSEYKENKKLYLEYKNISGCKECGYNKCNNSLSFHHNKDKLIKIANCRNGRIDYIKESIIEELNKCDIFCQNCHMEKHSDLEFFNNNINLIIEKSKNIRKISGKIDRELVRKMYFENNMRQIDIARYFDCSKGVICGIIKKYK